MKPAFVGLLHCIISRNITQWNWVFSTDFKCGFFTSPNNSTGTGDYFLYFYKESQTLQTHTQVHTQSEILFWTEIFCHTPVALGRIALLCPLPLLVWISAKRVNPCSGLSHSGANLHVLTQLAHFSANSPLNGKVHVLGKERGVNTRVVSML